MSLLFFLWNCCSEISRLVNNQIVMLGPLRYAQPGAQNNEMEIKSSQGGLRNEIQNLFKLKTQKIVRIIFFPE